MAQQTDPIGFDVRPRSGSCFTIDGQAVFDTANPVPGTLTINATDSAGKWVDVVVEGYYPTGALVWTTGHLADGQTSALTTQLQFYTGWAIKVTRWAPGFAGIPGNGGGEVYFLMPTAGDVTINITVTS
jgi:hypothetical protein